jgi:ORF6N domain
MEITVIQNKIYEIRGQKIMLDYDLAEIYEVETRVLNQAVKRNIGRFPKDFMLQLTSKEWQFLRSQIVMSLEITGNNNSSQIVMSSKKHRGAKYLPYAFTEHGVTMLAAVLKSD